MGKNKLKGREKQVGKTVSVSPDDSRSPQESHVAFSFKSLHSDCLENCEKRELGQAIDRLKKLSVMTWSQVQQAPREGLGYEWIPRTQLKFVCSLTDDVERVMSFRYSAAERLIGHRVKEILHVLWISKNHDAYDG